MPEPAAILIIHEGDSFYLAHCLAQARQSNPQSRVILLGDGRNAYYRGVEFYRYADYFKDAARIDAIYRHRSAQHEERWIRFCFQRWLIVREFVRAQGIERLLVIDTDVMVYGDLEAMFAQFAGSGFTVSQANKVFGTAVGSQVLIQDVTLLDELAVIMTEMFEPSALSQRLDERFAAEQAAGSGWFVTEMTALNELAERFPERVTDTCPNLRPENRQPAALDHSIYEGGLGWEAEGEFVKHTWIDGRPHARWLADGKLVPLATVHFQGKGKWKMRESLRLSDPAIRRDWQRNARMFLWRKYLGRIKGVFGG